MLDQLKLARRCSDVLPAFSLKFKIQEFKMAKNGHGGKRAGAGRPPLLPAEAKPERMKGAAGDITLSPARLLSPGQKWAFAELALRHAEQMLAIMVDIAVNGTSEAVRLAAADKVIDRAMGKAPAHIDITAMRHTDIVYQSAEELRAEFRKALEAEGVPKSAARSDSRG